MSRKKQTAYNLLLYLGEMTAFWNIRKNAEKNRQLGYFKKYSSRCTCSVKMPTCEFVMFCEKGKHCEFFMCLIELQCKLLLMFIGCSFIRSRFGARYVTRSHSYEFITQEGCTCFQDALLRHWIWWSFLLNLKQVSWFKN